MKQQKILIGVLAFASLAAIALPYTTFAITPRSNVFDITILKGPILICSGTGGGSANLPPCQNLCDLVAQIAQIIYFMIALVIWVVTPVLVAVGGIMYMFAGGNPGMVQTANKTITGAVIGIAIVLCAWLIVYTFVHVLNISGVGGFGADACTVSPPTSSSDAGICIVPCGSTCCGSGQICSMSNTCVSASPPPGSSCPTILCGGTCCAAGQSCVINLETHVQGCQ